MGALWEKAYALNPKPIQTARGDHKTLNAELHT